MKLLLLAALAVQCGAEAGQTTEQRMWMTVGERRLAIALTDEAAARELSKRLPLTLEMAELNGNEKHADLATPLPISASRPGSIRSGDLMLYGSKTLVIFYADFESSYSYTPLGRVLDPAGIADALGKGSVRIVLSRNP